MYAVIESGGQQHRVEVSTAIQVDRLPVPVGERVTFDRVYLVCREGEVLVGQPTVPEASVTGRVVRHFRGRKIRGFKYKPKKRYSRRFGQRAELTEVFIEEIRLGEEVLAAAEEEPGRQEENHGS